MAERRMLSSKIVCSDAFIEMPFSAQALYVQLVMEADDDGFLNKARRIQGSIGATPADLNLLIEKRFVLAFPNGVVAIKHWRMNNQIRKDRYTATQYQEEYATLEIKPDGAYTERDKENTVDSLATTWQPNGNQMATQISIGKVSIDKYSLDNIDMSDSVESDPMPPKPKKPQKHKYGEYNNVLLTDAEYEKLQAEFFDCADRIERLSSYIASTGKTYKSHYATIRNWASKDRQAQPQTKPQQPRRTGNVFLDMLKDEV